VPPGSRILLGGSTHPGEEAILADIFLRLRPEFPDLFLVLVPRHFERSREAGRELAAREINFVFRNEIMGHTQFQPGEVNCLLVNTTGELTNFYENADVIFVGKSLAAQGGQNPIEPGALGKTIVFGPHMQNFAEVARSFLAKEGAVQAQDATELERALRELLRDPARRKQLGENALQVVRENLGGIDRTVDMIVKHLAGGELYVAPKK
jgi:3-deoxy-D-manno-octulosonic-acid transferase